MASRKENRLHLLLLKENFSHQPDLSTIIDLSFKECPSYSQFLHDIKRIVADTGDAWHLRTELVNPSNETKTAVCNGTRYILKIKDEEKCVCYIIRSSTGLKEFAPDNAVEIYKIGVFYNLTHQGYGSKLLRYVLSCEFARGATAVYLKTTEENRIKTRDWYERNGFVLVGFDTIERRFINKD